jgi:hypothetical protein
MIRLFRQSTPRAAPDVIALTHEGRAIVVAVTRSASARRITLRVRAATRDAVVTLPRRASFAAARAFVESHAGWIATRLARLPLAEPFAHGACVPLRGVEHEIVHEAGLRGTVSRQEREGRRPCLFVAGDARHLARRVEDFLKREARRDLIAAVARHCAALNVRAASVSLRDTTSRWGSCSAQGALNFSWRLIMAPAYVLDYLAAHEVAHLVHHDHSDRFWTLTRRLAPETDRAEAWLKTNGASLHRYGAAAPAQEEGRAPHPLDQARPGTFDEDAAQARGEASSETALDPTAPLDPVEALLNRARAMVDALEPHTLDGGRRVA